MNWYEEDVRLLEATLTNSQEVGHTDRVVFYGSSSIRMWTTLAQDFPQITPLNLGFGGSTLASCSWYFEQIVLPTNPKALVFYAGDNDLGDGRHPEEVYLFFSTLLEKLKRYYPSMPFAFLSIKISPFRWGIAEQILQTNQLIQARLSQEEQHYQYIDMTTPLLNSDGQPRRELFQPDGLHLNPDGYRIWRESLQKQIQIF